MWRIFYESRPYLTYACNTFEQRSEDDRNSEINGVPGKSEKSGRARGNRIDPCALLAIEFCISRSQSAISQLAFP